MIVCLCQSNTQDYDIERKREIQACLYSENSGELKSYESVKAVERYVKKSICPSVKFFSDSDKDYNEPDFADEDNTSQTVKICRQLLQILGKSTYDLEQTISFWITYRKEVRRIVHKQRYASVRRFMKNFLEGMDMLLLF